MPRAEAVAAMQRDLVERAREGDLDAFSHLARASYPRLHKVAALILRDSDRAQDAVQDALVLAWRHLRSLRDPDAWDAWLHRLTVRACYSVARKDRRHTLVELHVMPDKGVATVPDAAAGVAERDQLGRELGLLHIEQRAVLVLHYYLDLPIPRVAEILDIPVGTAGSRLHRGLEAMRTSMRSGAEAAPRLVAERPA